MTCKIREAGTAIAKLALVIASFFTLHLVAVPLAC